MLNIKLNTRTVIDIVLISACIILFSMLNNKCDKLDESKEFLKNYTDTLETYKNDLGQSVSKINVLTLEKEKQFLQLTTSDTTIKWLQSVVHNYKGKLASATVGSTITVSGGTTPVNIYHKDTLFKDSIAYLYPRYTTDWKTKWEQGSIIASKDSIYRQIKIINEFELTTGEVRNKWFQKKELEVKLKNLNPNTVAEELRTFNVSQEDKTWTLGIQAGYGIGMTDFKPQPFIGFGINCKLIGIK